MTMLPSGTVSVQEVEWNCCGQSRMPMEAASSGVGKVISTGSSVVDDVVAESIMVLPPRLVLVLGVVDVDDACGSGRRCNIMSCSFTPAMMRLGAATVDDGGSRHRGTSDVREG